MVHKVNVLCRRAVVLVCMVTSLGKAGSAQFLASLAITESCALHFVQDSRAPRVGPERRSRRAVSGGLRKECADARSQREVELLPLVEKNRAI